MQLNLVEIPLRSLRLLAEWWAPTDGEDNNGRRRHDGINTSLRVPPPILFSSVHLFHSASAAQRNPHPHCSLYIVHCSLSIAHCSVMWLLSENDKLWLQHTLPNPKLCFADLGLLKFRFSEEKLWDSASLPSVACGMEAPTDGEDNNGRRHHDGINTSLRVPPPILFSSVHLLHSASIAQRNPHPHCSLYIVYCQLLITHCSVLWLLSEKLGYPGIALPHITDFTSFVLMWSYEDTFSPRTANDGYNTHSARPTIGGRSGIPTLIVHCTLYIVHCSLSIAQCSVLWLLSEKLGCPSIAVTPHCRLHSVPPAQTVCVLNAFTRRDLSRKALVRRRI